MIILDTNVLSELMRRSPERRVVAWLDRQPRLSVWTTSVTIFELRLCFRALPAGKRRSLLLETFEALLKRIEHRIVSFDNEAAEWAADLMGARRAKGHPMEVRDTMIAGIALAQRATVATRNTPYFEGVPVVNPWLA